VVCCEGNSNGSMFVVHGTQIQLLILSFSPRRNQSYYTSNGRKATPSPSPMDRHRSSWNQEHSRRPQFQRIPTNLSREAAPRPRSPAPCRLFLPPTSALPRYSYSRGSVSKGRLSTTVPRTPITPIWPSPRTGTLILSPLPIQYGRAAILTAPLR